MLGAGGRSVQHCPVAHQPTVGRPVDSTAMVKTYGREGNTDSKPLLLIELMYNFDYKIAYIVENEMVSPKKVCRQSVSISRQNHIYTRIKLGI